ncbi:hypothetical protein [Methylobacterium tarhaniae]|uniref:hypothetical protein n=1 Tax=Methylobacterium tarhaniae TaxID=1187852 RepID=UPI003D019F82
MQGNHRGSGIGRLDRGPDRDHGDIRIVVAPAPHEHRKERVSSYLPWPVKLVLKLGLLVAGFVAVVVLPNYLDCRGQRDAGLFYYGMSVTTCTRQTIYGQIGTTQKRFEDIARAIAAR